MSDFDIYNEASGGEFADRLPEWLKAIEMTSAPRQGRSLDPADPKAISGVGPKYGRSIDRTTERHAGLIGAPGGC
ncbi:hypothetical protein [Saccharopolyspora sp. NPDC002686]|uniref:hypothetical protein n=1 Tax=Saccharopolyspora sp. NPDC002686 TaxID=3154541 RepID=UPI003328FFD6